MSWPCPPVLDGARRLLLLALLAAVGGCESNPRREIAVGAAMSLHDALTAIGARFEAHHPDLQVRFHFASSGTVATQIISGAPLDAFASASRRHMERVIGAGLASPGDVREFASNRLVLIQPAQAESRLRSVADLPGLERIAIGDPDSVPAGSYARTCLVQQGLWERVGSRLVFAAHVRQVLDWVARGEVDSGLVYATDARARAGALRVVGPVPQGCHPTIVYPVSVLKGAAEPTAAGQFVDFLCGPEGRGLLAAHGFSIPEPAP